MCAATFSFCLAKKQLAAALSSAKPRIVLCHSWCENYTTTTATMDLACVCSSFLPEVAAIKVLCIVRVVNLSVPQDDENVHEFLLLFLFENSSFEFLRCHSSSMTHRFHFFRNIYFITFCRRRLHESSMSQR
jgi:hypothetical protein